MNRLWALAVCLLSLASRGNAERTALIFIQPSAAGPSLDIGPYLHPNWILWPAATDEAGLNRSLSIASGEDWKGEGGDSGFRCAGEGKPYLSTNVASLRLRGYFQAREDIVGDTKIFAGENEGHAVNPFALMTALGPDGSSPILDFRDTIPDESCVAYGAKGWDDCSAWVNRVDRALVVEYPPSVADQRWSRLWLLGRWPNGLPTEQVVPGLTKAKSAMKLLLRPSDFTWFEPGHSWQGANRWLEFVRVTGVEAQACLWLGTVFILILGVAAVARELRSRPVLLGLKAALLAPSAVLASGNVALKSGFGTWASAFALLLVAEITLSYGITWALRRWQVHDLFSSAAVSLLMTIAHNPVWSFYSPVLGHVPDQFSPQWVGMATASMAGLLAYGQSLNRRLLWSVGGAFLGAILYVAHQPTPDFVLMVAAVIIGLNFIEGIPLLLAAFAASDLVKIWHWAWTPGGLFHDLGQRGGIDVSGHVLFLASPGFTVTALVVGFTAACLDRYFWHEARRALAKRENRALLWLAAFAAVQGIANPAMLTSALMIAFAAVLALLSDAIRSL